MLVADPSRRITIPEIKRHPFWLRNSHNPRKVVPVGDMVGKFPAVSKEEVDEEIMLSLMSLGWGSDDEVFFSSSFSLLSVVVILFC